jgi:hypothetical protein
LIVGIRKEIRKQDPQIFMEEINENIVHVMIMCTINQETVGVGVKVTAVGCIEIERSC